MKKYGDAVVAARESLVPALKSVPDYFVLNQNIWRRGISLKI